jgi:hypothetical protein
MEEYGDEAKNIALFIFCLDKQKELILRPYN